MFQDMVKPISGGGGGSNCALSPRITAPTNTAPTWSGTPFEAKRVYMLGTGYYSGNIWQMWSNVNPSTDVVDNTKCWTTSNGTTWSDATGDGYGFNITSTSVASKRYLSGVISEEVLFIIFDK